MKKITKFICAALAACFTILPLSSCKDDDEIKTVRLNEVTHSVFYAPLYLADALGYFKEENETGTFGTIDSNFPFTSADQN